MLRNSLVEIEIFQIQMASLMVLVAAEGLKEYEADWLDEGRTVTRDSSGRFASSSTNNDQDGNDAVQLADTMTHEIPKMSHIAYAEAKDFVDAATVGTQALIHQEGKSARELIEEAYGKKAAESAKQIKDILKESFPDKDMDLSDYIKFKQNSLNKDKKDRAEPIETETQVDVPALKKLAQKNDPALVEELPQAAIETLSGWSKSVDKLHSFAENWAAKDAHKSDVPPEEVPGISDLILNSVALAAITVGTVATGAVFLNSQSASNFNFGVGLNGIRFDFWSDSSGTASSNSDDTKGKEQESTKANDASLEPKKVDDTVSDSIQNIPNRMIGAIQSIFRKSNKSAPSTAIASHLMRMDAPPQSKDDKKIHNSLRSTNGADAESLYSSMMHDIAKLNVFMPIASSTPAPELKKLQQTAAQEVIGLTKKYTKAYLDIYKNQPDADKNMADAIQKATDAFLELFEKVPFDWD